MQVPNEFSIMSCQENDIKTRTNESLEKQQESFRKFLQKKQEMDDRKLLAILDSFTSNVIKRVEIER